MDAHNGGTGDFNGDGRQDLLWGFLPHTVRRQTHTTFTILLNEGDGSMRYAPEMFEGGPPNRHMAYRTAVADFNRDGRPDIVAGSMGMLTRNPDGTMIMEWEPLLLMLLSRDGSPALANRQLVALPAGRYGAGATKFNYAAILDVGNDGLRDVAFSITRTAPYYVGRTIQLVINKGGGVFADETAQRVIAPAYLDAAHGEGNPGSSTFRGFRIGPPASGSLQHRCGRR